jgi:3D (Asp-Asp-Asp) domain-containing protein
LAGWLVPERLGRLASRLRSDFPVGKAILAAVTGAAIVLPCAMFVEERSQRLEMAQAYRQLNVSTGLEIGALGESLRSLLAEQEKIRSELLDADYTVVSDGRMYARLVATGYSSTVRETDDTPYITASNTRTRPGIVALSRDLLRRYNPAAPFSFGDVVHISGLGDFIVEDSMHWRWRRRIDIWFPAPHLAWRFGKREVTISMPLDPRPDEEEKVANDDATITGYSFASTSRLVLPQ